jgi:serine/threonine protein kinase
MIGQTISHYKILEHIGGGGMGVVYKAQDLKLDRFVALKFLSPDLTLEPEAKGHFIHETKADSAPHHNNICNVHEIAKRMTGRSLLSWPLCRKCGFSSEERASSCTRKM